MVGDVGGTGGLDGLGRFCCGLCGRSDALATVAAMKRYFRHPTEGFSCPEYASACT